MFLASNMFYRTPTGMVLQALANDFKACSLTLATFGISTYTFSLLNNEPLWCKYRFHCCSMKLTKVMNDLDYFSKRPKRDKIHGPVEADQEYQCIVEANNLMVEIDNEISTFSAIIFS